MAVLIKNATTYQKTKPLYEAYRKARNKEKYRAEHERGIILHEAAAKALKAAQIGGKLSNVPALQAEYEKLQTQKCGRSFPLLPVLSLPPFCWRSGYAPRQYALRHARRFSCPVPAPSPAYGAGAGFVLFHLAYLVV